MIKSKYYMKKTILFFVLIGLVIACGGDGGNDKTGPKEKPKSMVEDEPADDGKGIGEVKNVALNSPLKQDMVDYGKAIYELKCAACHKLSDKRVVGPGWKGVTAKRTPEWIMNMTLNVDVMLEKDAEARELLKQCLVRMPNQNLSETEARNVLEFMFANDGQEIGS
jgi:cytochrome c551/c552